MEITLIGWFLIPLGLLYVFFNQKLLYKLMVFFIPFSATAVINVGTGGEGSGLQATIYFGSLLIISYILKVLVTGRIKYHNSQKVSILLLILFLATISLSLMMPLIIDGDLLIIVPRLTSYEVTPLAFSFRHITQFIYLLYGVMITILIASKNTSEQCILDTLRTYMWAGLFVCLWGILQLVFYRLDIPYPDFLFNNSITSSAGGYRQEFSELNIKRISSVTVEPSVFAQYMLSVIPMVFFARLAKIPIISPRIDKILFFFMVICLLLSTSSTAYIGIALLGCIIPTMLAYHGRLNLIYIFLLIILTLGGLASYFTIPRVQEVIAMNLFNKMETYSGMERIFTILNAWEYFLQYPILGVGWGSVTSHDLVVRLLANTGLSGLGAFVILIGYVLVKLIKFTMRLKYQQPQFYYANATLISLLVLLGVSITTGFAYVFGHFWFILGIAIAVLSQRKTYIEREGV